MELLVVITIIVILSAMLLPALQKARGMAKYARWFGVRQDVMTHPNCIAYYDFEGTGSTLKCQETLGVKKAARLNGTISGATRVKGGGRWPGKGALYFDGDDRVNCGNDHSLSPEDGQLSIEVWVKADPEFLDTGSYSFAVDRSTGGYWGMLFDYNKPEIHFYFRESDGSYKCSPATDAVKDGNWHHVVGVAETTNNKLRLYCDGSEVGSGNSYDGTICSPTTDLQIGRDFTGFIDEVAIYNWALSAEEIKAHYRGGKP